MSIDAKAADPNAPVGLFLDAYCESTAQLNYAVMLTGPWGAGKTHLLKAYLADRQIAHIYVSLYGIASTPEIDDQIYRQLHPVLSSKYTKLAGVFARAVMKGAFKLDFNHDNKDDATISASLPEIDLKEFSKDGKGRLLVFDDLERAQMKPGPILGYINAFVEHEDAKAVILANEAEIEKDDPDFTRIKEKLIGQTLEITPSVESAFPELIKLVTDPWCTDFLKNSKEQVLDIFARSEAKNLRVLKQALWDFERVAKLFRPTDHIHTSELTEILQAILALSIEVRLGRLPKDQLSGLKNNRWARLFGRGREQEKTKLELSEERYLGIDLRPRSLDPDLVATLLTRGYVEAAEVHASLDRSPPFISPKAEPSWRRAWYGYRSSDADYAEAMVALEADFVARKFAEPYVLLHIFGILLNAARIGFGSRTVAQTKAACRDYIDDLAASDRFDLRPARPEPLQTEGGYDGLGFIADDTKEFQSLQSHLQTSIDGAWRRMLPRIADDLHDTLKCDPDQFIQQTTINNSPGPSAFWDVPLLQHIPPSEFVRTLVSLEPAAQVAVIQGLGVRYGRGDVPELQHVELPWLSKVNHMLRAELRNLGPMSRHRLKMALARDFEPHLPPRSARRKSITPSGGKTRAQPEGET